MNKLKEKTILITGAAKRLGKAIALHCAREGMNVIVHYRSSKDEAERTVSRIKKEGVNAFTVQADLSQSTEVERFFREALDSAGQIDAIVNNASVFDADTLDDFTEKDLQRNITINTWAPFLLSRLFSRTVKTGNIINLLDARVIDYDREHISYHRSKHGLVDVKRMCASE